MRWSDRVGRRLKPRDLHIFVAVAELGNMAKAAERLAISRPVVSKTISELERTLGVPLFDRSAKGVVRTLYGHALLRRSVAIFDELRQSVKEIEFLADPAPDQLFGAAPPLSDRTTGRLHKPVPRYWRDGRQDTRARHQGLHPARGRWANALASL
jgi:DNA-binding transcriptional LysR family regulator